MSKLVTKKVKGKKWGEKVYKCGNNLIFLRFSFSIFNSQIDIFFLNKESDKSTNFKNKI